MMSDVREVRKPAAGGAPQSGRLPRGHAGGPRRALWAVLVGVLAVVGGTIAYVARDRPEPAVTRPRDSAPNPDSAPAPSVPRLPFADITRAAGITFVHENGARGEKLLPETMGGGCAFFDYNGDGHQDILLTNSQSWPHDAPADGTQATLALYRNDGRGNFEDVTREVGLDVSLYGMGAAVGDYNGDGRVDLFLTALGRNRLFQNTGRGFVDVTEEARVAGGENAWSTSAGWFDADGDGDLDLFVCNYVVWSREFDKAQNFRFKNGQRAYGRPQNFSGVSPYLYRNEGDGTFTDISARSGIQIDDGEGEPLAKSLGVVFADVDNDGHVDVIVANDTVQNQFFHNRGDGTFEESAELSGIAYDARGMPRGAMGIDAAHFRDPDEIGVAIGNFANEMTALYVSGSDAPQFTDEAIANGLGLNTVRQLTFGLFFFDCDLDGRLDLLAANGHLESDINTVQPDQHYEQSPQLFWNHGRPVFQREFVPVPVQQVGADFHRPLVGRGAAYADIDGDGDLDVLIATTGRSPRLLRNDQETGHHWLRVKLVGSPGNRDAIGASVELETAGRTMRRQVMPTRSYLSQVELPVTFGLGQQRRVDRLTVRWPDGTTQNVGVDEVDRTVEVRQP